jgi:DNA-binding transcriptional MocR family regulator
MIAPLPIWTKPFGLIQKCDSGLQCASAVCIACGHDTPSSQVLRISAERFGVLWTPMAQFYLNGLASSQLRLSCGYLSPEKIEEGVRRLSLFCATRAFAK